MSNFDAKIAISCSTLRGSILLSSERRDFTWKKKLKEIIEPKHNKNDAPIPQIHPTWSKNLSLTLFVLSLVRPSHSSTKSPRSSSCTARIWQILSPSASLEALKASRTSKSLKETQNQAFTVNGQKVHCLYGFYGLLGGHDGLELFLGLFVILVILPLQHSLGGRGGNRG